MDKDIEESFRRGDLFFSLFGDAGGDLEELSLCALRGELDGDFRFTDNVRDGESRNLFFSSGEFVASPLFCLLVDLGDFLLFLETRENNGFLPPDNLIDEPLDDFLDLGVLFSFGSASK